MLALAGHFHDTGAGTSTPRAYTLLKVTDIGPNGTLRCAGLFATPAQARPVTGAVVGTHRVVIYVHGGVHVPGDPKKLLEQKYSLATETPLLAEVHAGGPQVVNFNVK